ncbi:DUF397 domain-containing protein [Kitasatospora sp. NPDC001119]
MTLHHGAPVPTVPRTDADPVWLAQQLAQAQWRSASTGGTNCAEVALLPRGITAVRDSLNPDQQPLVLSDAAFEQFADAVIADLFRRPPGLDSNPVTATGKNDLAAEWLATHLDSAAWRFGGSGSIGVAFLPRDVTAFCSPLGQDRRLLIFAQPEITDFFAGIRAGLFRR